MDQDTPVAPPADEPSQEEQCQRLIDRLKSRDPSRRLRAAHALRDAPFPVVPPLVAALDGTTPEHKEAILATFGLLGRRARSAIPCVEKLCEDELHGETARALLPRLRRRINLDRETLLRLGLYAAVAVMVSLGVAKEAGEWVEVWGNLHGPGRAIALAWGMLGGVAGYVAGANLPLRGMAWKGAKILGVAGIYFGALLGRVVGELVAPLVSALGG
jgi:hypothetical protein